MTAQNPANLKKGTRDFLFALREKKTKICGIEIQTRTAEQESFAFCCGKFKKLRKKAAFR